MSHLNGKDSTAQQCKSGIQVSGDGQCAERSQQLHMCCPYSDLPFEGVPGCSS
jgi:hypothetical protein